jgi:hypothetical protein
VKRTREKIPLSRRGAQCPSHYVHHDAMNKCSGGAAAVAAAPAGAAC